MGQSAWSVTIVVRAEDVAVLQRFLSLELRFLATGWSMALPADPAGAA